MFAVPNLFKFLMGVVFLYTANSVLANNTGYQIPNYCSVRTLNEFGDLGGDSLSYIQSITNIFHSPMPNSMKNFSTANNSSCLKTPSGATTVSMRSKKLHRNEIIQQLKTQITELQRELLRLEGDEDIIGAKVVYNEKFLNRLKSEPAYPLPECGYFIIEQARLQDDGRVMVRLNIGNKNTCLDGTHICLGNLKLYNPNNQ